MNNEKSNTTIADVARHAGVSVGTVSNVLNNLPVGASYRKRVEEAIRQLNYQVNPSAKALKSKRTDTIALIIPNTITPYFAKLTNYINRELEKHDYRMLLCFTDYDHDRETEFIQLVRQGRVDGIIALTYNPTLEIPPGIRFITIDRFFSVSVPCVASDNFGGGALAAEKLAALGCRHIAYLKHGSSLPNETNKRRDGFVAKCVELGIDFEICNLTAGEPLVEFEKFLTSFIKDGEMMLDGVFCGTDLMAHQVRGILENLGFRVPEDLQIVGFDGIQMFGEHEYICSTIVQPVEDIAEVAVNMVLAKDFSSLPQLITLPVTYQAGGTTRE